MSYKFQINLRPYHCLVRSSNRPCPRKPYPYVIPNPSPHLRVLPSATSPKWMSAYTLRVPTRRNNRRRRRPPAIRLPNGAALRDELFRGFSPLFIYLFFPTDRRVRVPHTRIYVSKRSGRFIFRLFSSLYFFSVIYLFMYTVRAAPLSPKPPPPPHARKGNRLNGDGGKRALNTSNLCRTPLATHLFCFNFIYF